MWSPPVPIPRRQTGSGTNTRWSCDDGGVKRPAVLLARHLLRVRDLIDRAYAEPLDVTALARSASVSPAYFTSLARAVAIPPASESAGLDARITWNTTLLSEFLLMNNNNAVDFKVSIDAHGLVLDTDADADAAFRTWRRLGGDDFQLLDGASLATVLAETESEAADFALLVCLSEDDDHTDPQPPVDHLVIHLLRDLIDTITKRVAGDGTLLLAYGNGWPLEYRGEGACLVLVGPELVGVIDVDDSY